MRKSRSGHVLATVMFTDIVGSTTWARELGDRRWRVLLAQHHRLIRHAIKRHHGEEVDDAGDGFFARFDDQVDAIRCACSIADGITDLGIEVRVGCHVGQAEVHGTKLRGVTVHAGARVMSEAGPSEVLVSSMLRDLVPASGFAFTDRGIHTLKGLEGGWQLYAVTAVDGNRRPEPPDAEELATRREAIKPPPLIERRWGRVAVAVAALAAIVGVATFVANRPRPIEISPRSLVEIDPATNQIVADVPVTEPDGAQLTYVRPTNEVWVLSQHVQSISVVDAATHLVTPVSAFPGQSDPSPNGYGIVYAFGKVWVTGGSNILEAFDPETKTVRSSTRIPEGPAVLAAGSDRLWATAGNLVIAIDPTERRVTDRVTDAGGIGIVVGPDAVWVSDYQGGTVVRVDLKTKHRTIIVPFNPIAMPALDGSSSPEIVQGSAEPSRIAVAPDGGVWVSDNENGVVYKIDPFTFGFKVYPIGGGFTAIGGSGIAYLDGSIWVTSAGGMAVVRLDPTSGDVQDRIPLPYPPNGLTVGGGSVWVTVNPESQ